MGEMFLWKLEVILQKKLAKWRSSGRQESMCFAATGRLQGRAAKLLLVRRKSWYSEDLRFALQLTARQ
jgi:hypothetical protein